MRAVSIAGVILAAGFSRRLGHPKQEVRLGGETLLERTVRTALAASLAPVIAVVRDPGWVDRLSGIGAVGVLNQHAAEGMSTSIHAGVHQAQQAGADSLVLLTCDQPLLSPAHLRALCADPTQTTASAYAGRTGIPAFFPAAAFPALLSLQGDKGARDLLHAARSITDEDLALDIDTEADLLTLQSRMI